ncbi:potassium channel family protein [Telluribacter humicola]|uniref:potassium channel family protein n=1 Tax=Telluribacter humicola TaxID=1720261 RepID=UPI001A969A92|nr:potassium channel family protein [Telluribacter humicola]
MNEFLEIVGIVVVIWTFIEGLWTTIWVDGNSGPLTSRLTSWFWKMLRLVVGNRNHKLLSLAGPLVLFGTVAVYILLIWLGWTLIFYAQSDAIVNSSTTALPDFSDVLWYIAYTMFTVGNGGFIPNGNTWQVLSAFVAFSGMAMVTLMITYLLQVVAAVAQKRALASQITGVGQTAEEFVIKQWDKDSFGAIELQLSSLSQQLAQITEQHLSFPILHFYHAARVEKSLNVAVAILDDALSLIELGVDEKYHPPQTILSSTRKSVDSFLTTLQSAFIQTADEEPQRPDLGRLREAGLPVVDEKQFEDRMANLTQRRKLLLGFINNGAWHWPAPNK